MHAMYACRHLILIALDILYSIAPRIPPGQARKIDGQRVDEYGLIARMLLVRMEYGNWFDRMRLLQKADEAWIDGC